MRFDYDLFSLIDKIEDYDTVCPCHLNQMDGVRLNSVQEIMMWYTMLWFGHSFVSKHSIH